MAWEIHLGDTSDTVGKSARSEPENGCWQFLIDSRLAPSKMPTTEIVSFVLADDADISVALTIPARQPGCVGHSGGRKMDDEKTFCWFIREERPLLARGKVDGRTQTGSRSRTTDSSCATRPSTRRCTRRSRARC